MSGALRPCLTPRCPNLVRAGRCDQHAKVQQQASDARRGTASERGYNWRWHKARTAYLKSHPVCVHCLQEGLTKVATVVDHIIPHKGDQALFWDVNNWMALCAMHHGRKTVLHDGGFGR